MGVIIPNLDAAQTANVYVCLTACVSPGPFPDGPAPVPPAFPAKNMMVFSGDGPLLSHSGGTQ